jgi:hypothetical protein
MKRKALIAAVGIAGLAATPAFAATTAAKSTQLSERVAHTSVKAGTKDGVSGTLRSGGTGLSGQRVMLERRSGGSRMFTTVSTHTTGRNGGVSFTVTVPKGRTAYELVYPGNRTYKASHSNIVTVTAR